jgi:site-specific DNA-methyltransferase (adenine-specific)
MKDFINKVIQGDCLDLMPHIKSKSINMILCDLPYGTTACKWDTIIPFEPLWEQYKRIIKDNGAIVLTASQPFTSALVMSNIKMFKYEWIWDKKTGLGFLDAKFRPLKSHENILIFGNGGVSNGSKIPMKYNPQGVIASEKVKKNNVKYEGLHSNPSKEEYKETGTNYPKSIQVFSKDSGLHPTQKPVALFEYLIKTYTSVGDVVLDNTIGSGTTAIAAIRTKRNWIGIEKDEGYYKIANKRIAEELKQQTLINL